MSDTNIDLSDYKCTGKGTCHGGAKPRPPLHDYPLLAWQHTGHHKHGLSVFTEDQAASVAEIAVALPETPSLAALASRFGTTEEHVSQAVAYAVKAGVLGR